MRGVTKKNELDKKIGNLDFGQFLFLYFLGRNVDYNVYKEILDALRDKTVYPNCPKASEMCTLPTEVKKRPKRFIN